MNIEADDHEDCIQRLRMCEVEVLLLVTDAKVNFDQITRALFIFAGGYTLQEHRRLQNQRNGTDRLGCDLDSS